MKTNKKGPKITKKPSRKQIRKQKRIERGKRRNEFFSKGSKNPATLPEKFIQNQNVSKNKSKKIKSFQEEKSPIKTENIFKLPLTIEQQRNKEKRELNKLQKQMAKQRSKQFLLANEDEDRNIQILEKQLKLNKKKTKGISKSFKEDGLDYLLEVCDSDKMKSVVAAEQQFANFNDDFAEDLKLMSGKNSSAKTASKVKDDMASGNDDSSEEFSMDEDECDLNEENSMDEESFSEEEEMGVDNESSEDELISDNDINSADEDVVTSDSEEENGPSIKKRKIEEKSVKSSQNKNSHKESMKGKQETKTTETSSECDNKQLNVNKMKNKIETNLKKEANTQDDSEEETDDNLNEEESANETHRKGAIKVNPDGTWEDIYGRLRNKDGSLLKNSTQKYIPPAVRAKMEAESLQDEKALEKLKRLKKQVKGLLNRLAERNMHSISTQIEELYMNYSRNDMNETLINLALESIVSRVLTPERLLMEHVLLMVILHANIGTEVGANFLQRIVTNFNEVFESKPPVEDKTLDNIIVILAQLYNFKLFDSKLMYEILIELSKDFTEKNIDCILHILRNVGFNLRKDDPLALKDLILDLRKKATTISENATSGTRVKFLLDILLAIKNNNMTKIPNYDTTYSEHLKKVMKGFIRKGNYVTQLNITLEDLLKADEKGKWWVVGSAWTGNISENQDKSTDVHMPTFSQKLLSLAKKQRMNTDTRRNIFCIIMSAEDYLDAFEKLLRLGLTNNQDREIIHVIMHCCLKEKPYNPYYAYLAQKFCDYDRKYQLTIKFSIWDKLKALGDESPNKVSNLAKLLTYLFLEKGLPISTLKVVQFSELDELTLRFMRQILLGILLHKDFEQCTRVFENVAQSDKLKMFRESLRLFIHHFLLKNLNSENVDDEQRNVLETRAKLIENLLSVKHSLRL